MAYDYYSEWQRSAVAFTNPSPAVVVDSFDGVLCTVAEEVPPIPPIPPVPPEEVPPKFPWAPVLIGAGALIATIGLLAPKKGGK